MLSLGVTVVWHVELQKTTISNYSVVQLSGRGPKQSIFSDKSLTDGDDRLARSFVILCFNPS